MQRLPAGTSIIHASGSLDGETRAVLCRAVADELTQAPAQLVLELSAATSIDDTAVEALVGATALAAESDTSICLVTSPTGPVARALAAADLTERFEIYATVGEAQRHG
ncbi:STAS domain-containing protein [Mycobacterium parmense]|uniref:STAS domain-containing protein n=1 Tax=Mycobacterium parmense TaxID=185642 RepID=UPI0013747E89|nr:STAS domain-containing protein [Mycobacterium parmense]MCV7350252.1 STAS domain-containing protein [Mycobacterium parmense]